MTIQQAPKHTLPRIIGRFVSGRALDGRLRADSTFFRRATKDLTPHGRASRWAKRPGWHRAAWRIGPLILTVAVAYGYAADPLALTRALIAATVIVLTFTGWRTRRAWKIRKHMRQTVAPMFITIANMIGHPPTDDPKKHLHIPHNYRTIEHPVIKLTLPLHWEGSFQEQKRVAQYMERKLGGDWVPRWHMSVYPPRLEMHPCPAPPGKVMLTDIMPALKKAKTGTLVLGYGTGGTVQEINLDSESPHIALSMGTGGGKTSTLRFLIAQLKRQGCERIDIVDPKRVSHNWARNIPGVYIHRTMAEQIDAIHKFRLRMESRYDALDTDPAMTFARQALVIEEQNSWMSYAETYWQDYRAESDPADRARMSRKNPAIADLAYCLFQGRQACMNIISVFQRMSGGAAGGGDLRENYGAKLLARCSPQTWKILTGTAMPREAKSRIPGRGMYVLGDEYHQTQFVYLREATAKDWPGMPEDQWRDEAFDYATDGQVIPVNPEPEPEPYVTLREACVQKVVPIRYGALRKARQRSQVAADGRFPAGKPSPAGTVYPPAVLRDWYADSKHKPAKTA